MTDQQPQPGVAVQQIYVPVQVPRLQGNGLATAGMVLGIITILIGIIPLIGLIISFVPTVLAIVFSIIGASRSAKIGHGLGRSIVGMILGGLTFVLYFVGYGTFW